LNAYKVEPALVLWRTEIVGVPSWALSPHLRLRSVRVCCSASAASDDQNGGHSNAGFRAQMNLY